MLVVRIMLALALLALPMEAEAQSPEQGWATILETYVTARGFRYEALRSHAEHRELLQRYVEYIGTTRPGRWSRQRQLAFYINAYNALTVQSVLELWPVQSVMREEGFFDGRRHRVAGEHRTLNQLENDIIRARFSEPRIHFAVNCASVGCPPLSTAPYTEANLERMLERQTRTFLRRTTRGHDGDVELSKLFEWFAADFERGGGVRAFVARYLESGLAARVRDEATPLRYTEYNWALNHAR